MVNEIPFHNLISGYLFVRLVSPYNPNKLRRETDKLISLEDYIS